MPQNYSDDGVRQERTGWRDMALSERHRKWGHDCPVVDIDFLVVEYNIGKPVCLVEYKRFTAKAPDPRHPSYEALSTMADMAKLPFILSFYWPDIWAFLVQPMNRIAAEHFKHRELLTERQYVERLYRMRRLVLSAELNSFLRNELPNEGAI